jgi:hypothetical protein
LFLPTLFLLLDGKRWEFLAGHAVLGLLQGSLLLLPISGWFVFVWVTFLACLRLYLGWGLWKLQRIAWKIALVYVAYAALDSIPQTIGITATLVGYDGVPSSWQLVDPIAHPQFIVNTVLGGLLFHTVAFYFLIKHKSVFARPVLSV